MIHINEFEPQLIWKYFEEITKIPRPSKKEGKIIEYLLNFGKEHGLETKRDTIGNVLITKPAVPGYEHYPTIVLQSHVDMVSEKNKDVVHDFENDSIQTLVDGDWLKAKGTTLGADNGIGVAAELAILASNDINHGKIECLFTVDEETGLNGASSIEPDFFSGKTLLNLDSEDEGEIFIGCAGGIDTVATFQVHLQKPDDNYFFFEINISGLRGGHSGNDIHLGRANANKLLSRFLWECLQKYDLFLSQIDGGNLRNAIPREAYAIACIPFEDKENLRIDFNIFVQEIEDEYNKVDPDIKLKLNSENAQPFVFDKQSTSKLLNSLYACPHGVISMSKDIPGLVETSTNLANIKMSGENKVVIGTSQRSSIESSKNDILQMVESVFILANAQSITHGDGYPGWRPNPDTKILKVAKNAYKELFGDDAKITAIHAGLECGLFLKKYPGLEMISFGPTMKDVHSPDEKLLIPSVKKFWEFLVKILEDFSEE